MIMRWTEEHIARTSITDQVSRDSCPITLQHTIGGELPKENPQALSGSVPGMMWEPSSVTKDIQAELEAISMG